MSSNIVSKCYFEFQLCPNSAHGCPNAYTAARIAEHFADCDYAQETCPLGGKNCGGTDKGLYLRKDRRVHFGVCKNHA